MYFTQQNITCTSIYINVWQFLFSRISSLMRWMMFLSKREKKPSTCNPWKNFLLEIDHIDHMVNTYLLCFIHCMSFSILQNIFTYVLGINKHRTWDVLYPFTHQSKGVVQWPSIKSMTEKGVQLVGSDTFIMMKKHTMNKIHTNTDFDQM